MKKLKAAIVGCGRISVSYADAFHRLSDEVELVYAVDKDPALAKAFAEEFILKKGKKKFCKVELA